MAGDPGTLGANGRKGSHGDRGLKGPQGDEGTTGPPGDSGYCQCYQVIVLYQTTASCLLHKVVLC